MKLNPQALQNFPIFAWMKFFLVWVKMDQKEPQNLPHFCLNEIPSCLKENGPESTSKFIPFSLPELDNYSKSKPNNEYLATLSFKWFINIFKYIHLLI